MSTADAAALVVILIMAATNYLMRAGGFWAMGHVPLTPRVRGILEALPGSIVIATVVPIVVKIGPAAILAIVAAAAFMILRGNAFLAVMVGVVTAALVRLTGI